MKKYFVAYALGILFGLLFFLPGIIDFNWSIRKHWITMLIFTPALIYTFELLRNFITKPIKENWMYLLTFIVGIVLCVVALFSL